MTPGPPVVQLCPSGEVLFRTHVLLKEGPGQGKLIIVESATGLLAGVGFAFGGALWLVRHPMTGMEDVWVATPGDGGS